MDGWMEREGGGGKGLGGKGEGGKEWRDERRWGSEGRKGRGTGKWKRGRGVDGEGFGRRKKTKK
jgi:hypothetical protein